MPVGEFPWAVQWLRLHFSMQGAGLQSLVGEFRSHMLHSMAKKKLFKNFLVK